MASWRCCLRNSTSSIQFTTTIIRRELIHTADDDERCAVLGELIKQCLTNKQNGNVQESSDWLFASMFRAPCANEFPDFSPTSVQIIDFLKWNQNEKFHEVFSSKSVERWRHQSGKISFMINCHQSQMAKNADVVLMTTFPLRRSSLPLRLVSHPTVLTI